MLGLLNGGWPLCILELNLRGFHAGQAAETKNCILIYGHLCTKLLGLFLNVTDQRWPIDAFSSVLDQPEKAVGCNIRTQFLKLFLVPGRKKSHGGLTMLGLDAGTGWVARWAGILYFCSKFYLHWFPPLDLRSDDVQSFLCYRIHVLAS